jgi:hypothetical protein
MVEVCDVCQMSMQERAIKSRNIKGYMSVHQQPAQVGSGGALGHACMESTSLIIIAASFFFYLFFCLYVGGHYYLSH